MIRETVETKAARRKYLFWDIIAILILIAGLLVSPYVIGTNKPTSVGLERK